MKSIVKNRLILLLFSLNVMVLSFFLLREYMKNTAKQNQFIRQIDETANKMDKNKFMKQDDYARIAKKGIEWHKTGSISDDDLQWCLDLLNTNPNPKSVNGKLIMQTVVTDHISTYIKRFTPRQTEMVYRHAANVLSGSGGNQGNDYIVAMTLLEATKDKRGIQLLLPLTASKNANVAKSASTTINYITTSHN